MPSTERSPMVIDAGLYLVMVVPHPYRKQALTFWRRWINQRKPLYAPYLWVAEVVSGLRRAVWEGVITTNEAKHALKRMLALPIQYVPDTELADGALKWARVLGQKRAYDAFYVALAEQIDAELWSADRKLVNGLHQQGATWAHWVGEIE
jgi:predicted nucleic acid-binding protein